MSTPGSYCKAYPADQLRAFPGFTEMAPPLRVGRQPDGGEAAAAPDELEYFYIHADYVVRAGIFVDRDIVFADVTPEWKTFCETHLDFRIPEDVPTASAAEDAVRS